MMKQFLLSVDEAEKLPEAFGERLFPKRMKRARRYCKKEDYLRAVGAGALLAVVLGAREEDLDETAYHKPFLKNSPLHFNLSHSGKYVFLAVGKEDIGADIEVLNPAHLRLAEAVFLKEEQAWMQNDPLTRFFTLWTLKEAVMKEQGVGLSLAPDSFSVLPLALGQDFSINGQKLFAHTEEYDGHIYSVCTPQPVARVPLQILDCEKLLEADETAHFICLVDL